MKRVFLYSIVLLLIFGCVKQETEQLLSQGEIGFVAKEIISVATKSEEAVAEDSTICVNLSVSGICEPSTRGMYVNTTTDFKTRYQSSGFGVWGYKGSDLVIGSNSAGSKVTFSQGVIWSSATSCTWDANDAMSFFAYAPYTTGNLEAITSVDDNSGSPTLSYTTPLAVTNQIDVVAAKNENLSRPADLLVPLNFKHILSAIEFKVGSDFSEGVIKSIAIKGVKISGTYDIQGESWSGVAGNADFKLTLNKTMVADSIAAGAKVNSTSQVMFMVPQTFDNQSTATIEIKYTNSSAPDNIVTILAPLKSHSWEQGKRYTYFIHPANDATYTFTIGKSSGTYQTVDDTTIPIISTKTKDRVTSNVGWSVEYSATGADDSWSSTPPSDCWVTVATPSDLASSANGTLSVTAQEGISAKSYTWEASKGTFSSPYNLSNPTGVASIENTANCYVINGPGFYKLPLVYGNAINKAKNSTAPYTNVVAYTSSESDNPFMSHRGVAISDPYILNNKTEEGGSTNISIPTGSSGASIVWQDVNDMVTNVSITGSGATGTFLTFEVSQSVVSAANSSFRGGNAVLAIKDSNGDIAWSWHIWVTDYKPGIVGNGDANYTSTSDLTTRTFARDNLGWVDGSNIISAARSYHLRFTQLESGKDTVIIFSSPADTIITVGSNTLYQWGRKDPMPGTGVIPTVAGGTTYSTSIKNPNTFYTFGGNWLSTIYYSAWNTGLPIAADDTGIANRKTIYDPCPVGYCVPNSYAFSGFSESNGGTWNSGYTWANLFFPASGFRNGKNGSLSYVGSYSYYWSFCADNKSAYALSVNNGSINSHTLSQRSYGYSIRPVRE